MRAASTNPLVNAGKSLLSAITVLTALIGFWAALPTIGIEPPRVAWYSEVVAIHKQIVGTRITIYDTLYFQTLSILTQNIATQNDLKNKGEEIPFYLISEEQNIRAKLSEQGMALKRYRDEYEQLGGD